MDCPNSGTAQNKDMPTTEMGSSGTGWQYAWIYLKLKQRDRKDEKESSGNDRNKKHGIRDNTRDRLTMAEVRVSEVENRSTEPQRKKRMGWKELFEEVIAENFSNIMKDIKPRIQEV